MRKKIEEKIGMIIIVNPNTNIPSFAWRPLIWPFPQKKKQTDRIGQKKKQ